MLSAMHKLSSFIQPKINIAASEPFYTISSFAFFTGSKLYIRVDCLQFCQNIFIQPHAACKRILGNLSQYRGQFHINEIYASGKSTIAKLSHPIRQLHACQADTAGKCSIPQFRNAFRQIDAFQASALEKSSHADFLQPFRQHMVWSAAS